VRRTRVCGQNPKTTDENMPSDPASWQTSRMYSADAPATKKATSFSAGGGAFGAPTSFDSKVLDRACAASALRVDPLYAKPYLGSIDFAVEKAARSWLLANDGDGQQFGPMLGKHIAGSADNSGMRDCH